MHEKAVPLIVNLSRSEKQRTVIASLGSSYNLSLCVEARKEMVLEDLVPAVMSCVEHAETMDLVCLGIASVYHLTCDRKGHDKESCLHLGVTGCTKRIVGAVVKHGGEKMVSRLCSRILLNMALEDENHETMVEEGVLEAVKAFQALGGEELDNATKIFSVLANSEAVLASLVDHDAFDTYCMHMLERREKGGEDDMEKLLVLSQVFLNVSLVNVCRVSLESKSYFEKVLSSCSLKSEILNMNVVGCIKVLTEDLKVKEMIMKTSAAGILSKVSQATSNTECKGLCGKILNGMSGRRSTVTYSEGSIVAVLSTFVEQDPDEVPYEVKPGKILVDELVPEEDAGSKVEIPKIKYNALSPSWDTQRQVGNKLLKPLKKTAPMQAVVLAPPQVFTLQTNGTFEKIAVDGLGKLLLDNIDLVSDNEAEIGEGGGPRRRSKRVAPPNVPPPGMISIEGGAEGEGEKKDDGFQFKSLKLDMGGLGGFKEDDEEDGF